MSLDGLSIVAAKHRTATATITRPGAGDPTYDPNTNSYTNPTEDTVHTGPCSIAPAGSDRVVDFGDGPVTIRTYTVRLSGAVEGIQVGDDLAVSGSRDPKLNGVTLQVLDILGSTWVTDRTLLCEERLT